MADSSAIVMFNVMNQEFIRLIVLNIANFN